VSLAAGLPLTACAPAARPPHLPVLPAHWVRFLHVAGVVDLTGLAAMARWSWPPPAACSPWPGRAPCGRLPGGRTGYSTAIGPEPYIAMADGERVAGPVAHSL